MCLHQNMEAILCKASHSSYSAPMLLEMHPLLYSAAALNSNSSWWIARMMPPHVPVSWRIVGHWTVADTPAHQQSHESCRCTWWLFLCIIWPPQLSMSTKSPSSSSSFSSSTCSPLSSPSTSSHHCLGMEWAMYGSGIQVIGWDEARRMLCDFSWL